MTMSYLRSIFGGHNGSSKESKSHRARSNSQPTSAAYNPYGTPSAYLYTHSNTPSPLRYPVSTPSDTRTAYGYGRRNSHETPRPHNLRRTSFKTSESGHHTSSHTPSASRTTLPSSRSNSSQSLFQGIPGTGQVRSSSSDVGHGHTQTHRAGHPTRPILKQASTWHAPGSSGSASSYGSQRGHSPAQSVTFANPHSQTLHMHPLLATTRLHRAPISYDVTFTPSARTVLDRTTHSAIPPHTLSQPATEPPTPISSRLVLRSHKFPWPIVVGIGSSSFGKPASSTNGVITNLDILYAIHTTLLTPITPEEWEALGHGSRAQMRVTKAYEERCVRMGGGWEGGVRRVDWLGGKTRLVGIEVDKVEGGKGVGKLVFGRA